ncbi:ATP-dependent nuclease [Comamonas thiooxydans]|uniref:ATP-dependent nuclease n=1 Tax=Comamonas thiooxydans TaxID=363952 RepID=UPI001E4F4165|nr:AAA family ATPase [Comamonas thiooxydans]
MAKTLQTVTQTAKQLGIHVGATATALLDAHSASFGDGAISLHSDTGIPLRSMGTGSTRLLIAGLHRATANLTEIVLVDELEHGLEPHRINRLLDSLGAKEKEEPLQVFMTTHSPVVLRELSGSQLSIVRSEAAQHTVNTLGNGDDVQAALRSFPEAFLAKTVLVCEGASEIGLVRGLDQYWTEQGFPSLQAAGVSYIDVGGGDADRAFKRAKAFLGLGYRVAVVQDNDKPPTQAAVQGFLSLGGALFSWRDGLALEDELFLSLPAAAITALIARAQELTEDGRVNDHIGTKSNGKVKLANVLAEGASGEYSQETRRLLGVSSRIRNAGWFKSITKMSGVAHDIVAPNWERVVPEFKESVLSLIRWARANA